MRRQFIRHGHTGASCGSRGACTGQGPRPSPIGQCRLFMVFDGRWKYIQASGFRPMLYDLESDPQEFIDRGEDPSCAEVIARLQSALFDWALHPKMHITTSNAKIAAYAENQLQVKNGILIGIWDEAELAAIRQRIEQRAKS